MKKTETKVSSVRGVHGIPKSLVRVERHSLSQEPNTAPRVTFNIPASDVGAEVPLPVHIPEELLSEIENCNSNNPDDVFNKNKFSGRPYHSKKTTHALQRSNKSKPENVNFPHPTPSTEEFYKLATNIMSLEEKLNKVESVLTKNVEQKITKVEETFSTFLKQSSSQNKLNSNKSSGTKTVISEDVAHSYNPSDYTDDNASPTYSRRNKYTLNSYVSELHKQLVVPLQGQSALSNLYPVNYDPKFAVSAIRDELAEWRRKNYISNSNPSFYKTKMDVLRSELPTSKSEEDTVSRDVAEKDTQSSSDSRMVADSKLEGLNDKKDPKLQYPLDRYLEDKEHKDAAVPGPSGQARRRAESENLIKKIHELTIEAEKRVNACIVPLEGSNESPASSSTSLFGNESSYTEHLVETKFKEVTFKQNKPKNTLYQTQKPAKTIKGERTTIKTAYSPRQYEEVTAPTASALFHKGSQQRAIKKDFVMDRPISRNEVFDYKPKKLGSRRGYINVKKHEQTVQGISRGIKYVDESSSKDSIHFSKSVSRHIDESTQTCSKQAIGDPSEDKRLHDACVNTDKDVRKLNSTLINFVSEKKASTSETVPRSYQIQEMPIVDIRPNLIKQIGPIINIKEVQPAMRKNNVAVVECVHQDVPQENTIISFQDHKSSSLRNVSSRFEDRTRNELNIQRSIEEFINKLRLKKGNHIEQLRRSLNHLTNVLSQITPFHKASVRLESDNFFVLNESIDLFFTNMDLVAEVVENELNNPIDKFCLYPECIKKAVDLLCDNIRSIFAINEGQQSFVKTPSSAYFEDTCIHEKELYIPFRKLVPGGKYKVMEEAESLSELELRRKRLKKVNQINQQLRAELPSDLISSCESKFESLKDDNVHEILNRTFVIDSGSNGTTKGSSSKAETKDSQKSIEEYEDDWEQEQESNSESGSIKFKSTRFEVEAQVHSSETKKNELQNKMPNVASVEVQEAKVMSSLVENEIHEDNNGTQINRFASTTNQPAEKLVSLECKEKIEGNLKNKIIELAPVEYVSFPVLRMTNPVTNALLEVRFPEQSDQFQSSLHVQKSDNCEEIKFLYNVNKNEKLQVPQELVQVEDIARTTLEDCTGEINKNEAVGKNVNVITKEDDQENKPDRSNAFENITTNFITFLENKVTEMVDKFKLSETECDKLFTERLILQHGQKVSRTLLRCSDLDHPNSDLKVNVPFYKSVSSLFSDKSAEELKFTKGTVSRGCSPDERMVLENLVSPPMVLQIKHDVSSQTDNLINDKAFLDVCVGPPESLRLSTSTGKNTSEEAAFKNKMTYIGQCVGLSVNEIGESDTQYNQVSEIISNAYNGNTSHNRLLPLPEDLTEHVSDRSFKINSKIHILGHETVTIHKCSPLHAAKVEMVEGRQNTSVLQDLETNQITKGTLENEQGIEETAIPLSRRPTNDEDADSQETLHILNLASLTESVNTTNLSPVTAHNLILNKGSKHENTKNENRIDEWSGLHNAFKNSQVATELCKNTNNKTLQFPTDSLKIKKQTLCNSLKENVHSLHISSAADPGIVLSSNKGALCIINEIKEKSDIECDITHHIERQDNSIEREQEETNSTNELHSPDPRIGKAKGNENLINNEASSPISDEYIGIFYYNSDEISEGEVGFVYTSNSYSSGEIKPLRSGNEYEKFSKHSSPIKASHVDRTSETNSKMIHRNNSSSDSISTGELKEILTSEDKLDEEIDSELIDFHLRSDNKLSSDSS